MGWAVSHKEGAQKTDVCKRVRKKRGLSQPIYDAPCLSERGCAKDRRVQRERQAEQERERAGKRVGWQGSEGLEGMSTRSGRRRASRRPT